MSEHSDNPSTSLPVLRKKLMDWMQIWSSSVHNRKKPEQSNWQSRQVGQRKPKVWSVINYVLLSIPSIWLNIGRFCHFLVRFILSPITPNQIMVVRQLMNPQIYGVIMNRNVTAFPKWLCCLRDVLTMTEGLFSARQTFWSQIYVVALEKVWGITPPGARPAKKTDNDISIIKCRKTQL